MASIGCGLEICSTASEYQCATVEMLDNRPSAAILLAQLCAVRATDANLSPFLPRIRKQATRNNAGAAKA